MNILERRRALFGGERRIKYGYLYNWYTTQSAGSNSISSTDMWRVPTWNTDTIYDFVTIKNYLDPGAGGKLKDTNTDYWGTNIGATNSTKFSGRRTHGRIESGVFNTGDLDCHMWTTAYYNSTDGVVFRLYGGSADLYLTTYNKIGGQTIRLVRPATAPEQLLPDGTYMDKYVGNDGTKYLTVKIGTQVWMAENLAETKYRNGDVIPNVDSASAWAALTSGARCAYNNDETNVFI